MRFRFSFFLVPLAAVLLAGACDSEGEGMPCDTRAGNGGNDDCASGLVCTTGLANAQGARCCPPNRQNATTPECSLAGTVTDAACPAPPGSPCGPVEGGVEAAPAEGGGSSGGDGAAEASSSGGGDAGDGGAGEAASSGGEGGGSSGGDGATE